MMESSSEKQCSFFKYCSAKTLKAIIENKTIQWSSPSTFNDPFDIQTDYKFGFEFEDFKKALIEEEANLIFGEEEPTGDKSHPLFNQLMMARKNRREFPSRDSFMEDSKKAYGELIELFRANMIDNQALWIKIRSNLKVYCVSKSKTGTPDNLLMWAHYAYKHMGAVIQHRCLKEQEMTDFGVFPVDYKNEMPIIANLNEYVKHFTGQKKLDFDNLAVKFALTKSDHWEYENEWRYIKYDTTNSNPEFEYVSIDPNKIEAIYLGCKIDEKELIEIKNLISGDLAHVKLFQAHQHTKFYKLEFQPIN